MSKTSLIAGLLISGGLHILLLLPGGSKKLALGKAQGGPMLPSRKAALRLWPKSSLPEEPSGPPVWENKPQIGDLEKVVRPSATNVTNSAGDLACLDQGDSLPPLRLVWDSPERLTAIARNLGMRILAVRNNEIVGELWLEDAPRVKTFDGRLTGFSNRVRTIAPQFFGPEILGTLKKPIESFWVLVPTVLDRQWVSIQRQAMRSSNTATAEVSHMEAKIVTNEHGHMLVITKIVKT